MLTRDRCRLDADVYRPDAPGAFPVLLMRQPYGRAIASTVVYAHPTWYAAHGFIVVVQDVRGRGTSAGEFRLFQHEVEDGYDTVEWAAQLPHSNGKVGMYGFSYQGMTQLFAAQARPPALRAIAPAMVGYHPHTDWAYEQGALLLQAGLGWAIQLAAETARRKGDRAAFQALYQASRQLPLHEDIAALPAVLTDYAPDSFFHDWVQHPTVSPYWEKMTPQLADVDLPMLHVGGWFDPYLRGDLRLYQEMSARSQQPQWLWIGPWGHLPWGQRVGARDFGPAANSPIDRVQVAWFTQQLQDPAISEPMTDALTLQPINLFEMGTNRWRSLSAMPVTEPQVWHLVGNGLAAMDTTAGKLLPAGTDILATAIADTLVHDPWRPVPSLGGHAAIPAGVFDRAGIDCRSDVLTYTTAPLPAALAVTGVVRVALACCCDRPSFDLCVTLSEVTLTGNVYPLTQGYGRFEAEVNVWHVHALMLQPTCFALGEGQVLRLSISAAAYPAYALNPGTGAGPQSTRVMEAEIITLAIGSDRDHGSTLSLPVRRA